MVGAIELLSKLASRDVRLAVDGDRLSCYARDGVLTHELREGIARHKRELIELLSLGESRLDLARLLAASGEQAPAPAEQPRARRQPLPQTATENTIAAIWRAVLGLESVGIDEDFFLIGGNSRLAMDVIVTTREQLQVELPLRQFFEQPTIRLSAAHIDEMATQVGASPLPADADERIVAGAL